MLEPKNNDSRKDDDLTRLMPVTVDTWTHNEDMKSPQKVTATRMATPTCLIPGDCCHF